MLQILVTTLLVITTVEGCELSKTTVKGNQNLCKGELIFNDEFEYLNFDVWQHENNLIGGGNGEFQWYTNNRTNSFVQEGILYITPTLTSDHLGESALTSGTLNLNSGEFIDLCTDDPGDSCIRTGSPDAILNPIKSARLRTLNSFSFKYGRVEVRAKMPVGDWIWPAIWLLPTYDVYGPSPVSGEIDLIECRGNRDYFCWGKQIGVKEMTSTLHWGPDEEHNGFMKTTWDKQNADGYNSDFHIYEVDWTTDYIKLSIDGQEMGSVYPPEGGFWELGEFEDMGLNNPWDGQGKMAPFDQEFYLIVNLAIGGMGYFPDECINVNGKPWSNSLPQRKAMTDFWNGRDSWLHTWNLGSNDPSLQVDYIRVYAN